jgi:hypothetical protein
MSARMTFKSTIVVLGAAVIGLAACGVGGTADLGDDRSNVGEGRSPEDRDPEPSPGTDCSGPGADCVAGTAWSASQCGCVSLEGASDTVPCGSATCVGGDVCCNESCGICTPPDGACTMQLCSDEPPPGEGVACGPNVCATGEVCCNESCGICTPPGGACTRQLCLDEPLPGDGVACGPNVCAEGEICCNESCGICTPPDGACTMQLCEWPAGGACAADSECALVEDYCGGCNCLGLPHTAEPPACADPVACFANPCEGKTVACVDGTCTVTP